MPTGGLVKSAEVPSIPDTIEAEDLLQKSQPSGGETIIVRPGAFYGKSALAVFFAKDAGSWGTGNCRRSAGNRRTWVRYSIRTRRGRHWQAAIVRRTGTPARHH
ncbi:MAG: hypothetical protein NTY19_43255 [Planctomycetota bacterium]|nr:hypothetical protein [Planctomycetota bacterium]